MNTSQPQARRAGWYKRLFAYMMAQENAEYDDAVAGRKRTLLGNLHGDVLEIGPGAGPNLSFYAPGIHWVGVEPNPAMWPYAQREAKQLGLNIELRDGTAEHLPAADNSVDAVVGTLVLCSVRSQTGTLQEILRVLKPGGQYVFMEHVAAPRGTGTRRLQNIVQPLWGAFADGCHANRETWTAIEQAGFSRVQLEHFRLDGPIAGPHIAGFAVK